MKTSGHVYATDALETLNIKPRHWKDLLTDKPFTRKDIICIQDPTNLDKFNMTDFYHLKHNVKVVMCALEYCGRLVLFSHILSSILFTLCSIQVRDEEEEKRRADPSYHIRKANPTTADTLKEVYSEDAKWKKEQRLKLESQLSSQVITLLPLDL